MDELGIDQFDFIYITGDAYVDHPSFGAAIITRLIEAMGFTIGIIAQPDWHSDRDFRRFGKPKYAFLVTSGNIDSMSLIIPPQRENAPTMRILLAEKQGNVPIVPL